MVDAHQKYDWLYYVPVANIFYDLLFDAPPAREQINECMGTFGLIAGLMVTVAQTVMNAIETEDAASYITQNYHNSYEEFKSAATNGFALLSAAMIVVVVHFLASSCSDVSTLCPNIYRSWWYFVRGNIAIAFILTVLGLTFTMVAAMNLFILQHAFSEDEAADMNYHLRNNLCGGIMGGCGVCASWLVMSLGLTNMRRMQAQVTQVAITADQAYEQLQAYEQTCANGVLDMDRDTYISRLRKSLGKHRIMNKMSHEFACLVFDTHKDEQLKKMLRHHKPSLA